MSKAFYFAAVLFNGPLISRTAERREVYQKLGPWKAKREIFMHPLTFTGGQKVPNLVSIVNRSHL